MKIEVNRCCCVCCGWLGESFLRSDRRDRRRENVCGEDSSRVVIGCCGERMNVSKKGRQHLKVDE